MISYEELIRHHLFQALELINLPKDEYVIFGSSVMFALGIRPLDDLDDLDLLVTTRLWNELKPTYKVFHDDEWNADHIYLFDEQIEIWNRWGPGIYNVEQMLKNAIKIGDFNFASIEDTIRWKKEMNRKKDLKHIKLLNEYLENLDDQK